VGFKARSPTARRCASKNLYHTSRHDRIRNTDVQKDLDIKNDIAAVYSNDGYGILDIYHEWALIDIHTFFYTAKFMALDQLADQERTVCQYSRRLR